ncbi:MAG: hypothetical protein CMJ81_10770 [Planctomycetaceae bacterium]|nr:hypothetical protein [Planctomycetaceae bacterium]
MLRILGRASQTCDGVPRRELLRVGALSLFSGLTMPRLLQARQQQNRGERPAPARSIILLNLFGGPSHLDMFDLKPEAAVEIRGEFKPIATSLPGLQICEHLPLTARWMDRATLIRTVTHHYNSHHPYVVFTGSDDATAQASGPALSDHPSMGAVCQYLELGRQDVPGYVFIPAYPGYSQNPRPGAHAGYLGRGYDPLFTSCNPAFEREGSFYDPVLPVGQPLLNGLSRLPGVTIDRLEQRRSLLGYLNERLSPLGESGALDSMDAFHRRAFSLLTSSKTRDAFDLSNEPAALRDRYGRHLYGTSMLIARRLVEAGTTFTAINWECSAEKHGGHWDMHADLFGMMRFNLPLLDQVYSALVQDLQDRGLLDSTLVVVMGEMGRTPRIRPPNKGWVPGRDHWPQCGFCLLTGGGVRSGMVLGASDKDGAFPVDRPVPPGDIVATIYQLLGVDPQTTIFDLADRPVNISHGGAPIWDVIA